MVQRRRGHVVAISSVQGKISVPFRSACESPALTTPSPLYCFSYGWESRLSTPHSALGDAQCAVSSLLSALLSGCWVHMGPALLLARAHQHHPPAPVFIVPGSITPSSITPGSPSPPASWAAWGRGSQPFKAQEGAGCELLSETRAAVQHSPRSVPCSPRSCRLMSLGFMPLDLLMHRSGVSLHILFCGLLISLNNYLFTVVCRDLPNPFTWIYSNSLSRCMT